MAIRIHFPIEEQPPVELLSYPVTELAMSLHVVADPQRQAALAPFVRRVRSRLPKPVLRELRDLSLVLGPPAPAPFAFPEGPPQDIPTALAEITPKDEGLQWTLSMLVDEFLPRRGLTPESRPVIAELERDPETVAQRLLQLLQDYWTHAFALEWPELAIRLDLARAEAALQVADGGLSSLFSHTTRRARLSDCGIAVTPTIPAEIDVDLAEDGRLPIVLSLFTAPYVITRISPAAGLVLPAPLPERRITAPSLDLVQGLNAVADPTRLTILRLIAGRPRSTRELAQLLELSEAAVSKHIHRLADADLVRGQRNGYYVLYRLVPERAAAASRALLDFLRVQTDSPSG
jgi:DNA-binding transcriptional ArsR family regulator